MNIYNSDNKSPPILHNSLKEVYHFLNWKLKQHPKDFTDSDKTIICLSKFDNFDQLSIKACSYTPSIINNYTEKLWSSTLVNKFLNEGYSSWPQWHGFLFPLSPWLVIINNKTKFFNSMAGILFTIYNSRTLNSLRAAYLFIIQIAIASEYKRYIQCYRYYVLWRHTI